jgi:hypothetical protein
MNATLVHGQERHRKEKREMREKKKGTGICEFCLHAENKFTE